MTGGHSANRRLIGDDAVVRPGHHHSGRCLGIHVTQWPGMFSVVHVFRERVIFGDGQCQALIALQIGTVAIGGVVVALIGCLSLCVLVTLDGVDCLLWGGGGVYRKGTKKHNDLIITCYLWKSPLRHSGSRDCLSDLLKALCFDSGLDMIISASVRRINQIVISYTLLPPPSVPVSLSLSRQDIRLRSILNSRISKQILWPGDSQTGDRGVQ